VRAFCFCDGTAVSRGDAVICRFDASGDAIEAAGSSLVRYFDAARIAAIIPFSD